MGNILKGFAALLMLWPGILLAQIGPQPWLPVGNTVTLAVSGTSSNVQLGWVTVSPTPPPLSAWVCNTGATDAYVVVGSSTVVATTNSFLVGNGRCNLIAINQQPYIAGITASSTTTLVISSGNGIPTASGSSGGGAAAAGGTLTPQGRLTLTTATPVMSADALAQTTVFYDCYAGNGVPVGATLANLTIPSCEISMGLDAVTPNIASGSNYDIFGVSNAGVLVLCAGPAWTSTTARGSGAGTTQLDQTNGGLWTNTVSLTHCWGGAAGTTDRGAVAAHAGTYLGSLNATANGQTAMVFRPAAAGGGNNIFLALYNAYQRVPYVAVSRDSTASWTYTSATWRVANAAGTGSGLLNRVTWLDGLGQSVGMARYDVLGDNTTAADAIAVGVNFDSTSATPGGLVGQSNAPVGGQPTQLFGANSTIALGLHFVQAMESDVGGLSTATFFGVTGGIPVMALRLEVMQ